MSRSQANTDSDGTAAPELFVWDELPTETVREDYWRTGIRTDHALVTFNWARPGYKSVGKHHHPYDQLSFILGGKLKFFAGDEEYLLGPGSAMRFPANLPHGAEPVGDEVVVNLDVFAPPRPDLAHLTAYQMTAGFGRPVPS